LVILLAPTLAPAVAHAEVGWDGGVVYQIGTFPVGPVSNTALGTRLEGGMHVGPLSVLGEYTFYDLDPSSTTAPTSWSAQAHRFGATLRYRFAIDSAFRRTTYAWIEVGAGEQLLGSNASVSRPDGALGLGFQMSFRNERGDRHVGFFIALRATEAQSPHDDSMPPIAIPSSATCRGPCPTMAPAAGFDRSYLFTAGVVFGGS
jgi:hypothetical protein